MRSDSNTPVFADPEELTQVERLAYPKCALVTGEDKLQQLLASAYAQYLIRLEVKEPRS